MRATVACVIAVGCGGAAPDAPTVAHSGPLAATPAGSDDVQIATVNGLPVWRSCVEAQAARHHLSRDAAVRECVDFELLAQAAAAHDASDPDESMKTALVSRFVELNYEDVTPNGLDDYADKIVDRNLWRLHRPEYRASTYVRVVVPYNTGPEVEARGKAVADAIEKELGDHPTGLYPRHLEDAAKKVADAEHLVFEPGANELPKDMRITWEQRQAAHISQIDKTYGKALWEIPEVGQVSPPIRTKWGWDVILFHDQITPREITRDELTTEMLPDIRRGYFAKWVDQIAKSRNIKITTNDDAIAQLDQSPAPVAPTPAPKPPAGATPP